MQKFVFACLFFVFLSLSYVSAIDYGTKSLFYPPELSVETDIPSEICNNENFNLHLKGAFYLNLKSALNCFHKDYEISVKIMDERSFWFDKTVYEQTIIGRCNFEDVFDNPHAPLKVNFDYHSNIAFNEMFQNEGSYDNIYFVVEVLTDPEEFEFNWNEYHIVNSSYYDFEFIDCTECNFGSCCYEGSFKSEGSQPSGLADYYFCSGENGANEISYVKKKDYYCTGVSNIPSFNIKNNDVCGNCEYCSDGKSFCDDYSSNTLFSYSDCDYKDTDCRDYSDTINYCNGFGNVDWGSCGYRNEVYGASCSEGICDGSGNCLTCNSKDSKTCYNGDVYYRDSCGRREEKFENCDYGCEDGACKTCSEKKICYNNDVYWENSCTGLGSKVEDCSDYCESGECKEFVCETRYDCGYKDVEYYCGKDINSGYPHDLFKRKYFIYCKNPGTKESYCKDQGYDDIFLYECDDYCENGECKDFVCSQDSDCGSQNSELKCYNGDVYNFTTSPDCLNADSFSASCNFHESKSLFESCDYGCENGDCINVECEAHSDCGNFDTTLKYGCHQDNLWSYYNYSYCNDIGTVNAKCENYFEWNDLFEDCEGYCFEKECKDFVCSQDSDCGSQNSELKCYNGDVYNFTDGFKCLNKGTENSECSVEGDKFLFEECSERCYLGTCVPSEPECERNQDCSNYDFFGYYGCKEDNLWVYFNSSSCVYAGTDYAYCEDFFRWHTVLEECEFGCQEYTGDDVCRKNEDMVDECDSNSDCQAEQFYGKPICDGLESYYIYNYSICKKPDDDFSWCEFKYREESYEVCEEECVLEYGKSFCEEDRLIVEGRVHEYNKTLGKGWNLISIPYLVENLSFVEIFGECFSGIREIKDDKNFYSKELPSFLNSLDRLSYKKSYWVYSEQECSFGLVHLKKPEECGIDVREGWNFMSYISDEELNITSIFGDYFDNIKIVKSEKDFYDYSIPGFLNTIAVLEIGKGYAVYSNESFNLDFNGSFCNPFNSGGSSSTRVDFTIS